MNKGIAYNNFCSDNYIELERDLLDLALIYLQSHHKTVNAYSLLKTCHDILEWNELRGKSDDKKIIFAPHKVYVHKKYLVKLGSQE